LASSARAATLSEGLGLHFPRPTLGPSLILIFGVGLALLVASPLVALLFGAFLDARPGQAGSLSLAAFSEAWSDPAAWKAAATSVWLGLARLSLVVPITIFLAWAISRTNMPLRRVCESILVSHIFLPFLPLAMAWAVLASPRSGMINVALRGLLRLNADSGPLNIFSYGGLLWLSALGIPTYLYLLIAPAFRSMDTSLEEAAIMSGSRPGRTLLRITVPVLAPAILGTAILAFVLVLQSFEPELVLGTPAGIFVFSTQIYRYIENFSVPRYGPATALSMLFLLVTMALLIVQTRLLSGRSFTTVVGRAYRVRPIDLGRWKFLVLAAVLTYVFLSTILPLATLTLASLMHIYGYFGQDWFTTEHYRELFRSPKLLLSVTNTLILSAAAATAAVFVASIVSYVHHRTKVAGRGLLDSLTWLPVTVPGIVLAVGMTWAYVSFVRLPFRFFGTIWILILAVSITTLPTAARVMNGTMVQISAELEESARVHGAALLATLRRIMLPLLAPAVAAAWLTLFAFAMKNFVTVSLLYSPQSVVVSALQYEMWNGGKAESATALASLNMGACLLLVAAYVVIARGLGRTAA